MGLTAIFGFLANARRWFNREAAAAVGGTIAAIVLALALALGVVAIYGAGGAAKEAVVNWRWLHSLSQSNLRHTVEQAARARRSAQAANEELARARTALDASNEARVALEQELGALKDNPIIYSLEERERLFTP